MANDTDIFRVISPEYQNPGKVHADSNENKVILNEYYLHDRRHRRPPSGHSPEYQIQGRYTPPATPLSPCKQHRP